MLKKEKLDKRNKAEKAILSRVYKNSDLPKEYIPFESLENYEENFDCWGCGVEITYYDEPHERIFCDTCKNKHLKQYKKTVEQYASLKILIMHERAMRIIEKSKSYAHEFKEASKIILNLAKDKTEMFMSSEEMVSAIVLYEYNFDFEINYKVGKYIVDFYIPELKVCLEVDGERHKNSLYLDNKRDIEIRNILGKEWEIVRIPTKYIHEHPSLIPEAIEKISEEKKQLRKQYGCIPEWFSKREKAHYSEILN